MAVTIRRVKLRNFKSIATCDVALGDFTLLVGPNGAGKSNFLDSLRFVADALRVTVAHALRDRGGIQSVRRRSRGHPNHFGISLEVDLGDGRSGHFAFTIAAEKDGGFSVRREQCRVRGFFESDVFYRIERGEVRDASVEIRAALESDRLALVSLSGMSAFRPLYDALVKMGFYNLNPEAIRELQDPDPGYILLRDGRNIASVLRETARIEKEVSLSAYTLIVDYLRRIVPGVEGVDVKALGPKETLEFRQRVEGDRNPWRFLAGQMSDGTLRSLGVLVAVFQLVANGKRHVSLAGIEEPEIAVHPGAVGVIAEALLTASKHTQIIVTTHSPDLLDNRKIAVEQIRSVSTHGGRTLIGLMDAASRSTMRDDLFTAGELLRTGQIETDPSADIEGTQLHLFDFRNQ